MKAVLQRWPEHLRAYFEQSQLCFLSLNVDDNLHVVFTTLSKRAYPTGHNRAEIARKLLQNLETVYQVGEQVQQWKAKKLMAMLGSMIGSLSHVIRDPANAIRVNSGQIQEHDLTPAELSERLQNIDDAASELFPALEKLLMLFGMARHGSTRVSLGNCISAEVSRFSANDALMIHWSPPTADWVIGAREEHLEAAISRRVTSMSSMRQLKH